MIKTAVRLYITFNGDARLEWRKVGLNMQMHDRALQYEMRQEIYEKRSHGTSNWKRKKCSWIASVIHVKCYEMFYVAIIYRLWVVRLFWYSNYIDSGSGVWSPWSELSPCLSSCYKFRQRFCSSSNRAKDCPRADKFGIETEFVKCSDKECYGKIDGYFFSINRLEYINFF